MTATHILIPEFDPVACDLGLKAAVERYMREQEELALVNDRALGELVEYAILREEGERP